MTVRQWVAHAGLDPRAHQSGTSVDKPARISKVGNAHIRRALFMPALVAVQHNRHVARLLRQARRAREDAAASLRRRHAEAAARDLRDVHDPDDLRRREVSCGRLTTERVSNDLAVQRRRAAPSAASAGWAGQSPPRSRIDCWSQRFMRYPSGSRSSAPYPQYSFWGAFSNVTPRLDSSRYFDSTSST